MMLDSPRAAHAAANLLDSAAIVADLKALAEIHAARNSRSRPAWISASVNCAPPSPNA